MTIVFRTDSSLAIGSGHVMRCLTLADELRNRGVDVEFVCREHFGHLIGFIEGKGFPVRRMQLSEAEYFAKPEDAPNEIMLGVSLTQDAADTITALKEKQPDWLIIDHYALDRRWEEMLRPHVGKIMVIDDLADRPHDCDLLLDQNLYQGMEARYDNRVPVTCIKLLGPKYALLRPEFAAARKSLRKRDGQVRRILVFFGGVDRTNETEMTLHVLSEVTDRKFAVDVIVGGGNPYKEKIKGFCTARDYFHYHCQVDNMAELMAEADLAIGAGGSTTWERCAVGVPSIIIALADNQKELSATAALSGLLYYLGEARSVSSENLLNALKFAFSFPETQLYYSANCLTTVDAKGTNRIVNLLCPPQIIIRPADLDDCDDIYEWRNAEETRRYIFDAEPIPLETHRLWYRRTLDNPNRILLIGEIDSKPVGVLRYDFSGEEALISVYLVPGGQGQGVGSELIRRGSCWLREKHPEIKIVNAEIFPENVASLRAFESAGYKQHHMIFKEVL